MWWHLKKIIGKFSIYEIPNNQYCSTVLYLMTYVHVITYAFYCSMHSTVLYVLLFYAFYCSMHSTVLYVLLFYTKLFCIYLKSFYVQSDPDDVKKYKLTIGNLQLDFSNRQLIYIYCGIVSIDSLKPFQREWENKHYSKRKLWNVKSVDRQWLQFFGF